MYQLFRLLACLVEGPQEAREGVVKEGENFERELEEKFKHLHAEVHHLHSTAWGNGRKIYHKFNVHVHVSTTVYICILCLKR